MAICKTHPSEPGAGVCALCLRDRLLSLPSCVTPLPYPPSSSQRDNSTRPLSFHACPSPLQRKKAEFSVLSTLFGTPGVGPSPSGETFCRGSEDGKPSAPQRLDQAAEAAPPSFSSWLAALFAVRCKRNKRLGGKALDTREASSAGSSVAASGTEDKCEPLPALLQRRPICRFHKYRGMSPRSEEEDEEQKERRENEEEEQHHRAAASSPSGSSTSSGAHVALTGPTPAVRNPCRRNPAVVEPGFAVCFSPLVHARQDHHHHRRIRVVAPDRGGAPHYGEHHNPAGFRLRRHGQHLHQHHRLRHGAGGGGVKLCHNRSRKLVDMGSFR